MIDAASAEVLRAELADLAAEAGAWFDDCDDAERAEMVRVRRVLIGSSLIDHARPDVLNVPLARSVTELPPSWSDARLFALVALAAVACARDGLEDGDEAYVERNAGAARVALTIAELLDVPRAQTQAAAVAKRDRHRDELQRYADAVRELGPIKAEARMEILAALFARSEKTIERWHAQARAAGLL